MKLFVGPKEVKALFVPLYAPNPPDAGSDVFLTGSTAANALFVPPPNVEGAPNTGLDVAAGIGGDDTPALNIDTVGVLLRSAVL